MEWTPENIRILRLHTGLTQTQFAAELAVRQATISLWENGHNVPRRSNKKLLRWMADQSRFPYP
jgi:DNA-binding transcriptional regulator YiaG